VQLEDIQSLYERQKSSLNSKKKDHSSCFIICAGGEGEVFRKKVGVGGGGYPPFYLFFSFVFSI